MISNEETIILYDAMPRCCWWCFFCHPNARNGCSCTRSVIAVKGHVVDDRGEPLIGATVKTKDAKTGAVTDLDGNFEIRVKANATLFVSYLGYKEREIAVRGRAIIESIQLSADNQVLDQSCSSGLWYTEKGRPYRFCIYRKC